MIKVKEKQAVTKEIRIEQKQNQITHTHTHTSIKSKQIMDWRDHHVMGEGL